MKWLTTWCVFKLTLGNQRFGIHGNNIFLKIFWQNRQMVLIHTLTSLYLAICIISLGGKYVGKVLFSILPILVITEIYGYLF